MDDRILEWILNLNIKTRKKNTIKTGEIESEILIHA